MFQVPGFRVNEYYERVKDDPVFKEILEILECNAWTNIHQAVAMMVYLDNAICWDTTCLNCSRLLDELYAKDCELERLKNPGQDSEERVKPF